MKTPVTQNEFKTMAEAMWEKVLSQPDPNKAEMIKREEMRKLSHFEIVLPEKPNHKKAAVNAFIECFCIEVRDKSADCKVFCGKGEWKSVYQHLLAIGGFFFKDEWSNGYREVFVSPMHFLTVTVCEGDLTVTVHATKESYEQEILEAEKYYAMYC